MQSRDTGWGERKRIHVDGDEAVTGASPVPREWVSRNAADSAGVYSIVDLVGNLRFVVLVLYCAAIVVEDAEAQIHLGDLRVDGSVENPVPAANYGFVIVERIPRKRHTGGEVLVVGVQRLKL